MLFALLYDRQDQVLAAAPACDHLAMGDQYWLECCLLYTSPSPRDRTRSRMPSSA